MKLTGWCSAGRKPTVGMKPKDAAWAEGQPVEYIILIASLNVLNLATPNILLRACHVFLEERAI